MDMSNFRRRLRKPRPKTVIQIAETDEQRDERRERSESAWAAASLAPAGSLITDGTKKLPHTALNAPVLSGMDALPLDMGLDIHDVVPGETWETVAAQYGVTVSALRAANPQVRTNYLPLGARLHLPQI